MSVCRSHKPGKEENEITWHGGEDDRRFGGQICVSFFGGDWKVAGEWMMLRSRRVLVVCHCLLNSNAKVQPLAKVGGVHADVLKDYIDDGVGLLQLPCPELAYLGINRWGMTREQYDHPNFRSHCESISAPTVHQIEAFVQAGYEIVGIMGMDGSPNCGVNRTCLGYRGGEVAGLGDAGGGRNALRMVPGTGVFMEVLRAVLENKGLRISFLAVDEGNPCDNA